MKSRDATHPSFVGPKWLLGRAHAAVIVLLTSEADNIVEALRAVRDHDTVSTGTAAVLHALPCDLLQ